MTTSASITGRSTPSSGLRKTIIRPFQECKYYSIYSIVHPVGDKAATMLQPLTTGPRQAMSPNWKLVLRKKKGASSCAALYRKNLPARVMPLSAFRFFHFFDQGWNYIEQIADHGDIGNFKDWRVCVFVDCNDGARALHPHYVLNRTANSQREIQLRCNRLSRRSNLAIHRQPAGIANRPRGRDLAAQRVGQLLGKFDVLLLFDTTADSNNNRRLGKVNCLFGFFERGLGLIAHGTVGHFEIDGFHRRGRVPVYDLVATEGAVLKGREIRRLANERHVGSELSLEHLACEPQVAALMQIGRA